jgi:hypothetical protein
MAKPALKPRTGVLLKIDPDLLAEIDAIAAEEERTRVRQIAVLLREAVADWRAARAERDPTREKAA